MTADQLLAIMPFSKSRIPIFFDPLCAAMDEFEINTILRKAAFLAQVGHESGQLRYVRELASGESYEGRKDLGNTQSGDGVKFKGRGLIQITGRSNYYACGMALGVDLFANPAALEQPDFACRSAGWFWKIHGLNEFADQSDMTTITRRINGGTNGLTDRFNLYSKAIGVLT